MDKIELIAKGFDVTSLRNALKDEFLWDNNKNRTKDLDSPHYGCQDIWARYAPPIQYGLEGPHSSIWYDVSDTIPIKSLIVQVCSLVGAKELGGVLITRIPRGNSVKPHIDSGWHAKYYEKFAISIEANEKQSFCFEDKELVTEPGDLFWFDNSYLHWVTNDSDSERVTIIICLKR